MSTTILSSSAISFLLLIFVTITCCRAQNQPLCLPSSCGEIHDISYPFRLKTQPKSCGLPGYELDCDHNNRTIINFNSKTYHVQTIDYDLYTIRVVDPILEKNNFCLFPNHTFGYEDVPSKYRTHRYGKVVNDFINLNKIVTFVNCVAPVNSPRYINTTLCSSNRNGSSVSSSSRNYSYVTVDNDFTSLEFDKSCHVEKVAWSSVQGPIATENTTLSGVYAGLGYGFELSWSPVVCQECEASDGACYVLETVVTCRHYCKEDTPVAEMTLSCKVEYYSIFVLAYGGIGVAGIVALRFIFGLVFLIGVVIYQRRRRHLSVDENGDDFLKAQDNQRN